ncbi:MAG TPA: zf-HC2 domain-containing protein, partial [Anaerolineae bacterium]|nr:zf-HC2 domain-containing protein [Anaerolineae bacterium]
MGEISKTPHVVGLISDYVLELLPGDESERVTAHLSRCPECRRAMATERQVGQSVRSTLQATSDIDQTRLRQAMPRPPVNADPDQRLLAWSPGLAAVGILLLIMCGTLVLYLNHRPAGWSSTPPAALSTAVITTNTPTQTATREIAATADQDGMLWIPEMAPASETREREA